MQAVILAAGRGERMGKLTENCPKPMLLIKNKPKLAWTLENLPEEISEVILIIGYLGEQIKSFFGKNYAGRKIKYVEQKKLNGSAGAVQLAQPLIKDKFLVLMGDDLYLKSDLGKMLKEDWAILVKKVREAERFGLVSQDKGGYLTGVIERPHNQKEGLINTGAYVLQPEFFQAKLVPISETEYGLPQTLVSIYPKYKTKLIKATKWQPVGSPKDLKLAEERIREFVS